MGLDTQAVLKGHLTVDAICAQLRKAYGAGDAVARPMRSRDHWMVEFTDSEGQYRALDVFLNSYAVEDYKELATPESTLVSMEFGPTSEVIIRALVNGWGGWVRRRDGEGWTPL
ncbi:MAG: hypothetical protein ACK5SX_15775 [Sandaracinobacter sp.]